MTAATIRPPQPRRRRRPPRRRQATTTAPAETTTTAAAATTTAGGGDGAPIVIGAAVDLTNDMSFFDGPALAAAQIQVDAVNAAGGVNGQQLELRVIDTELNEAQTQAAAIELIEGGAEILLVTCDVDFATPAITEGINAGLLTVAPCIGTDQMGPNRFGEAGRLAFSLGNMAQDEGAAMAELAFDQGKTKAAIVKDNLLVYFQDVVDAFKVRFEELGGEIVAEESFTSFDGTIGSVVTAIDGADADVIAVSSAFADLPATFAQQLRALGNDTTIVCSWGCDGSFWVPEGLSDFYYVTFASAFDDDPVPGSERDGARRSRRHGHAAVDRRFRHRGVDHRCHRRRGRSDRRNGWCRVGGSVREFRRSADAFGPDLLLGGVPHRVRAAVPG